MGITIKTEVIIVGAGPTGLALACQLIRYDIDFVIVDKQDAITPYSKAIGVQARTLEMYEQIGLADTLIGQGARAERVQLIEGGEVCGTVELSNIGQGMSPYPFLLIVEQSKHEHLLYDFLKTRGKEVYWQTELADFSQDETGVRAHIKTAGGETQTIEAKFLVGCDGAKSFVRHELGISFEGSTFERLFYVADVQIDWQFSHDALYVCLAQNTITAIFPMVGENRYRIVGTFPEEFSKEEREILYAEIEKQIVKDTQLNLAITNVNWFSVYKVHSRRVSRFSEGRCFLVGDAAHVHTPAGAQGMNTGIQDGYNLAWKMALVLRGKMDTKLLETYNEERLENAEHLLKTTDRLFDFGASEEPFVAYFRTHIFPHVANFVLRFDTVKQFIFPLISQIGIHYHNSVLSEHKGEEGFAVKAGDRMPYFQIGSESIYDRLHQPKFHLLVFSDGQLEGESDEQNDYQELKMGVENEYADWVDFNVFPLSSHVADLFGRQESFAVFLRPDNYIGFLSSKPSLRSPLNELQIYLQSRGYGSQDTDRRTTQSVRRF
jgi:2-polyprenyl-6-methoxyphenol hydroxylase-like FAD-dependent oxidoreductase